MQQQPGYRYPPGFRFYPTDQELLIYYLQLKINNQNPYYFSLVNNFDIYSKDPWDIWDEFGGNNLVGEIEKDQGLFFFTELKKASDKKGGSNFARSVPKGRWHGDYSTPISDSTGQTIGLKKYFVYKNKKSTRDNEQHGKWKMHEISSLVGPSSNYVLCQLRKNDKDKRKNPELEAEPAVAIRGEVGNHARKRQRFSYETNQGIDANFLSNSETPEFSGAEETPVFLESSFKHPTGNSSVMIEKPELETEPAVAIRVGDGNHARKHQRFCYETNQGEDANFLSNTETPEFSGAEGTPVCLESSFEHPTENSFVMIALTGESDPYVDITMSLDLEESLIAETHTCASTKSDLQLPIGDSEVTEYGKTEIADSGARTSHVLPAIILDSQPTLQSSEEHPGIASTSQALLPVDMVSNHVEAVDMGTGLAFACLPIHGCDADADDFIDWVQSLGHVPEIELPFLLPESGSTLGFYNES